MQAKGPFLVVKTTWEEFVQETSIAGLANSGKTRNGFIRRTFWQIAFIIMFSISLKQIIEVFKSYYEYPVTTSVTVNGEQQVTNASIQNKFVRKVMTLESKQYTIFLNNFSCTFRL